MSTNGLAMAQRMVKSGLWKAFSIPPVSLLRRSRALSNTRFRSSGSSWGGEVQVLEVDLGSVEADDNFGVKRLEEAIHAIDVRRSAPDWLPFLPGSSYWVPPRKTDPKTGLVNLLGKLRTPMTTEESLSFTSERGWPSYDYFVDGSVTEYSTDDGEVMSESDQREDEP